MDFLNQGDPDIPEEVVMARKIQKEIEDSVQFTTIEDDINETLTEQSVEDRVIDSGINTDQAQAVQDCLWLVKILERNRAIGS